MREIPIYRMVSGNRRYPQTKKFEVVAYAQVDDSDYLVASQIRWSLRIDKCKDGTTRRYAQYNDGFETTCLHRLILGLKSGDGRMVDHIDGDGLNCQSANLREATYSQNNANRRKSPGSSQLKGVSFYKEYVKWQAKIKINGRTKYLGCFPTERAAGLAYDAAARIHFGAFAKLNFPEVFA